MKGLTIGQVIDTLQLDEVALKVNGVYDGYIIKDNIEIKSIQIGLHYDLDDNNILKSLTGEDIVIRNNPDYEGEENFVIIKREIFEKMKNGILDN